MAYEGGEAVFIDSELDTWNMCPEALEKAFELYPEVKLIVLAHLYGTPAKVDEIRRIADKHGALIVEDAAESFGSKVCVSSTSPFFSLQEVSEGAEKSHSSLQTGMFGDYSIISFIVTKILTSKTDKIEPLLAA